MQFMVIETFKAGGAKEAYRRFRDRGRLMPEGLEYIGSWVQADLCRVFQLMACDDAALLQRWVTQWNDIIDFEIVPVVPSSETVAAMAPLLDDPPKAADAPLSAASPDFSRAW